MSAFAALGQIPVVALIVFPMPPAASPPRLPFFTSCFSSGRSKNRRIGMDRMTSLKFSKRIAQNIARSLALRQREILSLTCDQALFPSLPSEVRVM